MPNLLFGSSILVFAQEPFSAHCLQTLLKGAGADVHAAASVHDALSLLERQPISAAVLDAGGAGSDVVREITQRLLRLELPLVVCAEAGHRNQHAPGISVLLKPVRGTELIETLGQLEHERGQARRVAKERADQRVSTGASPEATLLRVTTI